MMEKDVVEEENCEDCDKGKCQEHCDHEYDPSEGMMCIICNKEYPY